MSNDTSLSLSATSISCFFFFFFRFFFGSDSSPSPVMVSISSPSFLEHSCWIESSSITFFFFLLGLTASFSPDPLTFLLFLGCFLVPFDDTTSDNSATSLVGCFCLAAIFCFNASNLCWGVVSVCSTVSSNLAKNILEKALIIISTVNVSCNFIWSISKILLIAFIRIALPESKVIIVAKKITMKI